jgi:pimeloyl-ACP methyl ester carboxylesterase
MDLQVDGKNVFAATGGRPFDAALPVVVFVHGAGMDHTVWALQTRWFAWHGRSVLAMESRMVPHWKVSMKSAHGWSG